MSHGYTEEIYGWTVKRGGYGGDPRVYANQRKGHCLNLSPREALALADRLKLVALAAIAAMEEEEEAAQ